MIHIGQRIKDVFDRQPKTHTVEWFAAQLNCKRANIYNIFTRPTLDVQLLFQISQVLEHDFFHDLTVELAKNEGIELDEKQEVYNELMFSMGRLINRQLKRMAFSGKSQSSFQLNRYDSMNPPLPASKYIVSVKTGENEDVEPHIHIYSIEEKFEIRVSLMTKRENLIKMLPVTNYGTRPTTDTFSDIKELAHKWLFPETLGALIITILGSNAEYAMTIYRTLNPKVGAQSFNDGWRLP